MLHNSVFNLVKFVQIPISSSITSCDTVGQLNFLYYWFYIWFFTLSVRHLFNLPLSDFSRPNNLPRRRAKTSRFQVKPFHYSTTSTGSLPCIPEPPHTFSSHPKPFSFAPPIKVKAQSTTKRSSVLSVNRPTLPVELPHSSKSREAWH